LLLRLGADQNLDIHSVYDPDYDVGLAPMVDIARTPSFVLYEIS
jgi:hypothetical protein